MAGDRSSYQRRVSVQLHEELGHRIQEARQDADINQAALADELGVSRATISKIEGGKQRVRLDQLYLIAYRLGIPVTELLPNLEDAVSVPSVTTAADDPLPPEVEEQASQLAEYVREELRASGSDAKEADGASNGTRQERKE